MGFMSLRSIFGEEDRDMAKRPKVDEVSAARWADRLKSAGLDKDNFETVVSELQQDATLTAGDIIAVAHIYSGGGRKASSKKAALSVITKRFVELVRYDAKNKGAAKARPW